MFSCSKWYFADFLKCEVVEVPEVESILGNVLTKTNVVWHPKKFKAHKKVKSTIFHITLCSTSQQNSTFVEMLLHCCRKRNFITKVIKSQEKVG